MYDVFISCKSEDYPLAKGVYEFLNNNGVRTFLASESLRRTGNTEYLNEIDDALDGCKHLIVFCTKAEYAKSEFVKMEWQLFRSEKYSGRKSGNILSIVGSEVQISDLPISLRSYEVIKFSGYKSILLNYVGGRKMSNVTSQIVPESSERPIIESTFQNKTIMCKGIPIEMVAVKGGTFTMGATSEQGSDADSDEKPHSVTLSDYYIGKFEVTQELWQAVMGNNPSYFKGSKNPVENVSWNDCQDFIRKLNQLTGQNFRLPTEAEWEYAARGGNKSCGYKYSGSNNIGDVAWYDNNSGSKTHTVGTKSPNELGIYDMSGNVWEWCQDWCGSYGSGSQTNPKGASSGSGRVRRGDSWLNSAQGCRVSDRGSSTPDRRGDGLGFRLAVSQ